MEPKEMTDAELIKHARLAEMDNAGDVMVVFHELADRLERANQRIAEADRILVNPNLIAESRTLWRRLATYREGATGCH